MNTADLTNFVDQIKSDAAHCTDIYMEEHGDKALRRIGAMFDNSTDGEAA